MERTLTINDAPVVRKALGQRLFPLWRHAVFVLAAGTVLGTGVFVRLDTQQIRKDLDRTSRAVLEAQVLNDRLALEMESRRRTVAMERAATSLQLGTKARLVDLKSQP